MRHESGLNRWPASVSVVLFLIIGIAATTGALRTLGTNEPTDKLSAVPTKDDKRAAPIAQPSAYDGELGRLIDQMIDTSDFAAARWGVCVISLRDGRTLYARNADKLFTPASNMKIYTTAVALDLLGPEYRWRTSVYAEAQPDPDGAIKGDLTLYGRGAPDLTSRPAKQAPSSLTQLADALYQLGVRRIKGNVVGDESYFRAESWGDGWQWNDIQWYFGAEPSALSIDGNEVDVEVKPPSTGAESPLAKLNPPYADLQLTSNIVIVKSGEPLTVGIHRGLSDNKVHIWGEFPAGFRGFSARLSVHDPAHLAATLFISALKTRGIAVEGEAHTRDFRVPRERRFDPSSATELSFVSSQPLAEITRATNKESINLNAELILRTLGRERAELAPDTRVQQTPERTDDAVGLALIRQWLDRAGVATRDLALHDGSGLSRLNLVTPGTTVGLLRATARSTVFRDSLPLAGTDGTLRGRLTHYRDRISAKTGSLTYDNSLSGFLTTAEGEELVFSIMCNDETSRTSSIRLIDKIVALLAEYSANKSPKPQKS